MKNVSLPLIKIAKWTELAKEHNIKGNNPDLGRQGLHFLSYMKVYKR